MVTVNKPKEVQVLFQIRYVGTTKCSAPIIGQKPIPANAEAGLVVASVGFIASVNHDRNYLKMFPSNCPVVLDHETWQMNCDSVPSKWLGCLDS